MDLHEMNPPETYYPVLHVTSDYGWSTRMMKDLEEMIEDRRLTHVEELDGETYKIRTPLNRRSIPINSARTTKTRVPLHRAKSFGVMRSGG